jgi:hypothetical protein
MSSWPRPQFSIMAVMLPFVILFLVLIILDPGLAI